MQIDQATTAEQMATIRALFQEYAAWLQVDLCFQKFAEELASLPGHYAPPNGRLFLATSNAEPAGCVALRPAGDGVCEMKRLYVRPAFRGQGLGKRLAERIIADARSIGYSKMVLDTLPFMKSATQLYQALGFKQRVAYYDTPLQETIFMELQLS